MPQLAQPKDVGRESGQAPGLLCDHAGVRPALFGADPFRLQKLRVVVQYGKRRAHLVRDVRHEIAAQKLRRRKLRRHFRDVFKDDVELVVMPPLVTRFRADGEIPFRNARRRLENGAHRLFDHVLSPKEIDDRAHRGKKERSCEHRDQHERKVPAQKARQQ